MALIDDADVAKNKLAIYMRDELTEKEQIAPQAQFTALVWLAGATGQFFRLPEELFVDLCRQAYRSNAVYATDTMTDEDTSEAN